MQNSNYKHNSTESKIYKAIIAGIAKYLRVARHSMLMMIKMYRIALSLKLQFLNFNANNFNLELSKKALKKVTTTITFLLSSLSEK